MAIERNDVLLAAATVLVQNPAASMTEIASGAGISRATLHRLVDGRDALIEELSEMGVERGIAAIRAARTGEGDPVEAVRRVIVELMPSVDLWVLAERIQSSDEVLARYAEMDTLLVELFRRGQRAGAFCVTQSATWMTEALYALLIRAVLAAHDGRLARQDIAAVTERTLLAGVVETAARAPSAT
ncbi:TetR/AcrR family transcriptional regulator [Pseudonocardia spirodelae]|uniref:TetR family transcriptional regulator n=1 Tax=Pseudonocardia spirodelae TaxID=3133431 RepID=A0ABU8TD63_9PSEU